MSENLERRFELTQREEIREFFVKQGFVVIKNCLSTETVDSLQDLITGQISELKSDSDEKAPYFAIAREIAKNFQRTLNYEDLITDKNLVSALETLIGPDINMIDHINFWVNDANDTNEVASKSWHQEYWSGPNEHDVTVWFPIEGVEKGNGLSVIPASHYYGHMPHRNRTMLKQDNFNIENELEMDFMQKGDVVLFHSFLIHATAGTTPVRRISCSLAYRNMFAPMSYKYRTFGDKSIQIGPMARVLYGLGNDQFSPLRTYGGAVSNDVKLDTY